MLAGNKFGDAGHRVVIEGFLAGEEASFIAMVDGKNVLPMATSQDHKARDDGDQGPNTGGMGAYSPAPVVSDEIYARVMDEIIRPTVAGMAADGNTYTGFLYAGLMISPSGAIDVVEFNCRFGDPEAQPVMMRLQSDLVEHCLAAVNGTLDTQSAQWDSRRAVGVVLAAGGYPEAYASGAAISGLDAAPDSAEAKVFHAGTKLDGDEVVTSGGRVLCAVALGDSVAQAQASAYELARGIEWENVYFRQDIGYRAIAREKKQAD
jgi:phosphoribosylamine--glycine ligase